MAFSLLLLQRDALARAAERAAHEARASGADPRALRSFAGVTSTLWETWYADGLVPEERIEISRQLVTAVAE